MTQKLRAVYNNSDKTIIGFLAEDLDAEDHEARCPEGVKVTSNYLEFDDDIIVYLHDVSVNSEGLAVKE
tara:strand:- start:68 stop:274 length:207 start_codon:yes stop_codon:yes gene_type:complete